MRQKLDTLSNLASCVCVCVCVRDRLPVISTISCFLCPGSCFCPQDVVEEAVLLLLITESMVRHTHIHTLPSLAFPLHSTFSAFLLSKHNRHSLGPPVSPPFPSLVFLLFLFPHPLLHSAPLFVQASGEAVISRLPDQAEARQASLQDATSVYDLLTIGMARRGQYAMLSEVR